MAGRYCCALLLILAAAALPARAETFKWVDEKGVTNYSNTPPARPAKAVQALEDRVSTYESDPSLKRAAQNPARAGYAEAEWLQRQRLMALAGYPDCGSPYRADCGNDGYRSSAYYPPYFVPPVFRSSFRRTSFFPAASRPPRAGRASASLR
jgi:hypothetical protein